MRRIFVQNSKKSPAPPSLGVSGDRVFWRRGGCTFLKVVSAGVIVSEAGAMASIISRWESRTLEILHEGFVRPLPLATFFQGCGKMQGPP